MGRQTRFYAHPDDYGALAAGLDKLGAVSIDDQTPTGEPIIRDIASLQSIWLLLTRPEFLASLHPRYSDQQHTWFYSVSDDPLVELHMGRPHAGILRPGRVYFTGRALAGDDADLHYRDKSSEFVAFAERVRRWIRRWCQKRQDLLLAPSLAARFDRGELARKGAQGELELLS
jgi:hypothetical protein